MLKGAHHRFGRLAVSFIVDEDPVFAYTAWHLAHSIVSNTDMGWNDIHLQLTPEVSVEVLERFAQLGCHTHRLTRFGDGKFCNKLAQWENLRDQGLDHVVFLDTDMLCVADFTAFLPEGAVAGKVVDLANPELPLLDMLFDRVGFVDRPPTISVDASEQMTFQGNCNGGFYSVPVRFADALFNAWRRHALALLADITPLRDAHKESHVDQISFCMALHETGLPFSDLPSNANYFVHFEAAHRYYDPARPVALLHYHNSSLNVVGLLEPPGAVAPHEIDAVAQANAQIGRNFESRLFWDMRYRRFPERGSGIGSRGTNLEYKRDVLRAEGIENARSVLDVGCGDLEVVGALDLHNYVGIDQSPESLAVAREKKPDWLFLEAPACDVEPADFVLCLEVAIHQPTHSGYRALIEFLAGKTARTLIISGYDVLTDQISSNHMLYFHESLQETLRLTGRFCSIRKIGAHSDVTIYRCDVAVDD